MLTGDWRDRAACRNADPRLFDPLDGAELRSSGCHPTSHPRIRQAVIVRGPCPVRADCDRWAEEFKATGVCAGRYRSQGEVSRAGKKAAA